MTTDERYPPEHLVTFQGIPIDRRAVFSPKNLFDLKNDPQEKHNLYGLAEYQSVIDSMSQIESITKLHSPLKKFKRIYPRL
jgi:hypothetical protein